MIDAVWLNVLQRIPPDYQDAIAVTTVTGTELVIQQIFRLERDFMVVRARTAGTMDTGRTLIVAYAQIDFMAFNKPMVEEAVNSIFAEPMPEFAAPQIMYQPAPAAAPALAATTTTTIPAAPVRPTRPLPPTEPTPVIEPSAEAIAAETSTAPKPGQISKTILLARLRERLAEKAR